MTDEERLRLLVDTAKSDDRIRAVVMNGSRTNPKAKDDIFQDFDISYIVTSIDSFVADHRWIDRFGERMILQMPETMEDPPAAKNGTFAYLMQLADGGRIDLTLVPVSKIEAQEVASLSLLLLDKDGIFKPFDLPSDRDHLPKQPTAQVFSDCCNEFWWMCTNVAKGLWREEIIYAKHTMDSYVRTQLMKMIIWYDGLETGYSRSSGKFGKHLDQHLSPHLWQLLQRTYSDADYTNTWNALETMCELFRTVATRIAKHLNFEYPILEDTKVSAHLMHVRSLPKNATQMSR